MPYYKCTNDKCSTYDKQIFVDKVRISYDSNLNKIDLAEECPQCKGKRVGIDTPMPQNITLRGVMKYK